MTPQRSPNYGPMLFLLAAVTILGGLWFTHPDPIQAAPELTVYASPIHAGCYLATKSTCKIRVDPFTINNLTNSPLYAFQILANNHLVYDFRTDASNPPIGNYSPSRVKMDFAATCGKSYTINLIGRDLANPSYYNLGQAGNVVCPPGTYETFLPVINR